ncbi:MAG: pentapeptide repeat-containing protein, partial [Prosthecobacter sp.]
MPGDSITILHLSDPQFGKNHVFGRHAVPNSGNQHNTLLTRTCDDLTNLEKAWGLKPDIVVLTGDLAEWGTKVEFAQGFEFLAGIASHLGIAPEQRHRVAVIPGNHDVERNLAESEFAEWRADGKNGEPFGFKRWKFFAQAFEAFYEPVPKEKRPTFTIDDPHSLFVIEELHVVLAGLNSTLRECHLDHKQAKKVIGKDTLYGHHGWCGEDQYRYFAEKLVPYEKEGWLRVGLVHHNVVRGSTDDDENLLDSPMLRERLGPSLNLLLHGHTHVADRSLLPGGQPILSTGSNALGQDKRRNETPNQYQILKLSAEGVELWMRAFNHDSPGWMPDARIGGEMTPGRMWIPHQFHQAGGALSASARKTGLTPVPQRSMPAQDDSREDQDKSVSSHVKGPPTLMSEMSFVTIAELRWPGCRTQWHKTEPPYLGVVTNDEHGHRSFPVGLLRVPFSHDDIKRFDEQTASFNWERWLVCPPAEITTLPVWTDLKELAAARGVRLLSWRDYERMSDLRVAVDRQKDELMASREYPPALYISQGMEFYQSPVRGQAADEMSPTLVSESGFAELIRLIEAGGPNFFLIDGNFGAGKTFLLRQLALHFSKDGTPVIPLLIELRSLDKVQNASDMLVTRLGRLGQQEIKPAQLSYMAEAGHLLILFDGYDELALRVSFERAADHLATITEAARGRASVVLTCRTQHFLDDHQMVVRLLDLPGLCRVRLQPFTQPHMLAFLDKKLGSAEEAQARFELICGINDLLGLSENPRMLSFIADLPAQDLAAARNASADGTISAAGLYEAIIDRWLRNEVRRHSHLQRKEEMHRSAGARAVATAQAEAAEAASKSDSRYLTELWEAMTRLAFEAWGRLEKPFNLEEIQETIAHVSKNLIDVTLAPDERTHGIASGSLLSREGPGLFAFAHYSIPEFLVSRELARQCLSHPHPSPVFTEHDAKASFRREIITDLMAEFLVDEMGWQGALDWAVSVRAQSAETASTHDHRNALRLLDVCEKRMKKSGDTGMQRMWAGKLAILTPDDMSGADLRGRQFGGKDYSRSLLKGADLTQAGLRLSNFSHADFENAVLVEADLTRCVLAQASFRRANLSGGNLSHADLRGANLTEANLTRATLIGADLRGAVLTGSQWHLARLAGAKVDSPGLAGLPAFGVGLPDERVMPLLTPASSIQAVAWAPEHDVLATGHGDGLIMLWDAASGQALRTLEGHSGTVVSVAFSPDGSRIASGSSDKTLRLWDAASSQALRTLQGHSGTVVSVAFSPDGSRIASGSSDETLRLWD